MRHHVFEVSDSYPIAILIKGSAFNKTDILVNYVDPLEKQGVSKSDIVAFTLQYNEAGKAPAKLIKEYLDTLLPELRNLGVKLLYVADSAYFKTLTGCPKAEPFLGYVLPCKLKAGEGLQVTLGLNHQALIYNPALQSKLSLSLNTASGWIKGTYKALGGDIIHSAQYKLPNQVDEIRQILESLHQHPSLTCDIEGFSLRFWEAGIGTISFAWDEHNGVAFACDYRPFPEPAEDGRHGEVVINPEVRALLKDFFNSYAGEIIFHKADYDVSAIIFALWMEGPQDYRGMLEGLDTMAYQLHDTKIVAYLATNSTAGNQLSLKTLAHEFAGNWAVDEIHDITRIPLDTLLHYNLVDALSTRYVLNKYMPVMIQDKQLDLYYSLMLPSLKLIIQLEMTGMPMCTVTLGKVRKKLEDLRQQYLDAIMTSPLVIAANHRLQVDAMVAANAKLKVKQHPLSKFAHVVLNPNSGPQLQKLLYEEIGLPVIDFTDTKQPATGADTIEKLINHTTDPDVKSLLQALIDYGGVQKILSTFIPAFEKGLIKADTRIWLHGSFNIGGTVSGRLSSSDPNLQNLPAGSIYGKLIKSIFIAPLGWLFAGADFNSLEDYISALTTKDPNKLKVYEGLNQYIVTLNGVDHRINENTIVEFDGETMNGKALYALLQNRTPRAVHHM